MCAAINTGVIGLGSLGMRLARAAAADTRGAVVALAEIDADRRAEVGEELDVDPDQRYADFATMLAEVTLDAVIIATPHALHYEQIVGALERDLHVLCEKPLTVDLEHAKDLAARDAESDRTLMVGYQKRIQGPFRAAKDYVAEWDTPPTFLTAEITQNWIPSHRGSWRTDPDLSGGGHLYDTGSHLLDVVLWLSDRTPTAVTASMDRWDEDSGIDVRTTMGIEFADGGIANVSVSGDAPAVREHVRAWGDGGAVFLDGNGWNDRTLRTMDPDGAERYPFVRDACPNKVVAFFDAIEDDTAPPATARDALHATAVTEAAYEADETGKRVTLDIDY